MLKLECVGLLGRGGQCGNCERAATQIVQSPYRHHAQEAVGLGVLLCDWCAAQNSVSRHATCAVLATTWRCLGAGAIEGATPAVGRLATDEECETEGCARPGWELVGHVFAGLDVIATCIENNTLTTVPLQQLVKDRPQLLAHAVQHLPPYAQRAWEVAVNRVLAVPSVSYM